ncbi:MAG TPA: hypothetical protein VHA52_12465, partial [Candidatus Babeliaceae bacterium]|nr:hypothetical protein [Candidatus Babeliaceae bacterium]
MISLILLFIFNTIAYSVTPDRLVTLTKPHPFSHDLGVKVIPSEMHDSDVTICCHGYGHNHHIVDVVHNS